MTRSDLEYVFKLLVVQVLRDVLSGTTGPEKEELKEVGDRIDLSVFENADLEEIEVASNVINHYLQGIGREDLLVEIEPTIEEVRVSLLSGSGLFFSLQGIRQTAEGISMDPKREEFASQAIIAILLLGKAIVDQPSEVQVWADHGEQTTVIHLRVADGELGKVIGKQGRMAKSLRTILECMSAKAGFRAVLQIEE